MVKQFKGFTLIEVMIVIVIMGILAAIAYPSYQEYVRSTKRADAQAQMLEIAHRLQRFKVANFSFKIDDGIINGSIPIIISNINNLLVSKKSMQ